MSATASEDAGASRGAAAGSRGAAAGSRGAAAESRGAAAESGPTAIGDRRLAGILKGTTELARAMLEPPVEASMTLIEGAGADHATTPAATAEWALALDQAQYRSGVGPCLQSAGVGQLVLIPDTGDDHRWPAFAAAAAKAGVSSSLSLPLPLPVSCPMLASLNLYARDPHAFGFGELRLARQFAGYAAMAIANTAQSLADAQRAAQLQEAMGSRAAIEQAKGILMALHSCSEEEAFRLLVTASQRSHRKLREVAREFVRRASR